MENVRPDDRNSDPVDGPISDKREPVTHIDIGSIQIEPSPDGEWPATRRDGDLVIFSGPNHHGTI